MTSIKATRTRNLRYKRPALLSIGWHKITSELYEIYEACELVRWYEEIDEDMLLDALDDDEEAFWEFKAAFANLGAKAETLIEYLQYSDLGQDVYDDCTVALIGNRYKSVGYDDWEEDYFELTKYEQELAQTDAGKRFMRMTKKEMLSTIGQCVGILIAFLDLRQSYDYLKATMDILKDENIALLNVIKQIEQVYEDANETYFNDTRVFDRLLSQLPDKIWAE
jgi:hypothetical protein